MRLIIDRFEEEYAVCEKEDRTFINIKKVNLPSNCKENDILEFDEKNKKIIKVEQKEEEKKRLEELIKDLWK